MNLKHFPFLRTEMSCCMKLSAMQSYGIPGHKMCVHCQLSAILCIGYFCIVLLIEFSFEYIFFSLFVPLFKIILEKVLTI